MIYLRLLHLIIFFISDKNIWQCYTFEVLYFHSIKSGFNHKNIYKILCFFSKANNKIKRQAIQNIQLLHSFSTSIQKIAKIMCRMTNIYKNWKNPVSMSFMWLNCTIKIEWRFIDTVKLLLLVGNQFLWMSWFGQLINFKHQWNLNIWQSPIYELLKTIFSQTTKNYRKKSFTVHTGI
jgi:hypothetical protein